LQTVGNWKAKKSKNRLLLANWLLNIKHNITGFLKNILTRKVHSVTMEGGPRPKIRTACVTSRGKNSDFQNIHLYYLYITFLCTVCKADYSIEKGFPCILWSLYFVMRKPVEKLSCLSGWTRRKNAGKEGKPNRVFSSSGKLHTNVAGTVAILLEESGGFTHHRF
jgi:hypothetical protein